MRPRAVIWGAAAVLGVVILALILVQADVFDWVGQQVQGRGYLSSYLLLYSEETASAVGIKRSSIRAALESLADNADVITGEGRPWLTDPMFEYWLRSRGLTPVGRDVAHTRLARIVHLTPERLEKGEAWFRRYGLLAIIFGRHVVGFRIPITVACGVLHVPYPVFVFGVAISTAVWAGFWVSIGAVYGLRAEDTLNAHRWVYWTVGGALVVGFAAYIGRRWWVTR